MFKKYILSTVLFSLFVSNCHALIFTPQRGLFSRPSGAPVSTNYPWMDNYTDTIQYIEFTEGISIFTNTAYSTLAGNMHNGAGAAAVTIIEGTNGMSRAVSFDGGDEIVGTNNVGITGSSNRTTSVWYKRDGSAAIEYLLSFGSTASYSVWAMTLDAGNTTCSIRCNAGNRVFTLNDTSLNTWHQLTFSLDGDSTADVTAYQDGVLLAESSVNDQVFTTAAGHLHLGEDVDGDGQYTGDQDTVIVIDAASTSNQVNELFWNTCRYNSSNIYNGAHINPGKGWLEYHSTYRNTIYKDMSLSLTFDTPFSSTGTVPNQDRSDQQHAITTTSVVSMGSLSNGWAVCNGSSSYGTYPDANELSPQDTNFTVTCWLNFDTWPANQNIIDQSDGTDRFLFYNNTVGDGIMGWVFDDGPTSVTFNWTNAMPTGSWVHVAMTMDRATGLAKMYTNTIEVASIDISSLGDIDPTEDGWLFERDEDHGGGGNHFDGKADFINFYYATALSGAQITNDYNAMANKFGYSTK